jgi:hypothetical protein
MSFDSFFRFFLGLILLCISRCCDECFVELAAVKRNKCFHLENRLYLRYQNN